MLDCDSTNLRLLLSKRRGTATCYRGKKASLPPKIPQRKIKGEKG